MKEEFGRKLMKKSIELVKGTHWEDVLWPKPVPKEDQEFLKKFWSEWE